MPVGVDPFDPIWSGMSSSGLELYGRRRLAFAMVESADNECWCGIGNIYRHLIGRSCPDLSPRATGTIMQFLLQETSGKSKVSGGNVKAEFDQKKSPDSGIV
jgi:hypothetical protein